jgi:hypothetical protein
LDVAARAQEEGGRAEPGGSCPAGLSRLRSSATQECEATAIGHPGAGGPGEEEEIVNEEGLERWTASLINQGSIDAAAQLKLAELRKAGPSANWQSAPPAPALALCRSSRRMRHAAG